MKKAAVYSGTRNVYADMVPAAKSLFLHTPVDKVYFLIEDEAFPYPLPDRIETVNVADQTYFGPEGPNYRQQWSWMVLMRAVLTKVLPEEERILSLDNDTLVLGDVSELWDLDMAEYYFAGVREPGKVTALTDRYYNFGVNFQNLDRIRADGIDEAAIRELNENFYTAPEQDVMNMLCKGRILELPWKYNVCNWTRRETGPRIRHFAREQNWQGFPEVRKYSRLRWRDIPNAWK